MLERVLTQSRVASTELADGEKAKLAEYRNAMYTEQEIADPDTGVSSKQSVEAPKLKAYKKYEKLYNDAFMTYNTLRIKAMVAANAEDVIRFTTEEPVYRHQVTSAMAEWEAQGFKSEIESMQAYITQVTGRDLTLWKADVVDRFKKSKLSLPTGETFYFSSLVPASFVDAGSGWTKYRFTDRDGAVFGVQDHAMGWSRRVLGSVHPRWRRQRFHGHDARALERHELLDVLRNHPGAHLAGVARPCLSDQPVLEVVRHGPRDIELSDGELPPTGTLIGYPTMALFIRNVLVDFSELHDESNELNKTLKAGGSAGWGPIKLSGSYSSATGEKKVTSSLTERGLEVPQMQAFGYRARLFDTPVPHPLADIPSWV